MDMRGELADRCVEPLAFLEWPTEGWKAGDGVVAPVAVFGRLRGALAFFFGGRV